MHKLLESKENKLAATYNIQPVSCEKIALRRRQPEVKLTPDLAPEYHYPLYPLEPNEPSHTTPQKKMFFLQNDEEQERTSPISELSNCNNHNENVKSVTASSSGYDCSTGIPDVKQVPDYMNIPNLWNVQLVQPETEKTKDEKEELHPESSSSSSEWELV